jgi:hypothetical protein
MFGGTKQTNVLVMDYSEGRANLGGAKIIGFFGEVGPFFRFDVAGLQQTGLAALQP